MKTLRKVQVLTSLTIHQLQRLCDILCEETYSMGDEVVVQGDAGEKFFLIQSGQGQALVDGTVVMNLRDHDYFGERALISKEPRAATVVVTSPTMTCLTIGKRAFEDVLGPLQDIIDEDRKLRESRRKSHLAPTTSQDVTALGIAQQDDLGFISTTSLTGGNNADSCLRTYHKVDLCHSNLHLAAVRSLDVGNALLTSHITSPYIISPISVFNDPSSVNILYDGAVVGDIGMIMEDGAIPEYDSKNIAGCIALGLNAVHQVT